jgi:sulfide dehydrogenase cytochrome subunit
MITTAAATRPPPSSLDVPGMNATRVFVAAVGVLLTAGHGLGAEAPAGASSCAGCHSAASGSSAMRALGGMPAADITASMTAFRSGSTQATIMDRIAKGFTEEEIRAIATWYAAQKP